MSELGQTRRSDRAPVTSGLPLATDILSVRRHVLKVPAPEVGALNQARIRKWAAQILAGNAHRFVSTGKGALTPGYLFSRVTTAKRILSMDVLLTQQRDRNIL